jgi:AAA domain
MVAKKSASNEHVLSYLQYYCDPKNNFDYAVLLTGPWGVGKTFLIKRFLESRTKDATSSGTARKHLYVSLYGMTSVQQIDDELFRQLHPVLASKAMKVGWSVLKGALKGTLKIDIDAAGKDELTVSSQIPDAELQGFFKTPQDALLIFDDLERCSMPLPDVLGYINAFVEHNGFKVILIANEAELLKRENASPPPASNEGTQNNSSAYELIKEKLIGQTLEVRSSAAEALGNFLVDIRDARTKRFLEQNEETVLALHKESETHNLRLLKHALWDYERISSSFKKKHWANETAMSILFNIVLALAIEVRAGRLNKDEFSGLSVSQMIRLMRSKGGNDNSVAGLMERRYPSLRLESCPLGFDSLKDLLFEGWVDHGALCRELDESRYYVGSSEPAWLTAWRGWEVGDEEFEKAVSLIERQFKDRHFQNLGEMVHIFGLRLFFSEIKAIDFDSRRVVKQCVECLDQLAGQGKIEEVDIDELLRAGSLSCLGHIVTFSDKPEFKEIFDYFEKIVQRVKAERLPEHAKSLLALLRTDPIFYLQRLCVNNVRNADYYNVPILATIPVADFVDEVLRLDANAQRIAFSTFKCRYETGSLKDTLASELDWLRSVRGELEKRVGDLRPMSRARFDNWIRTLDVFVK